MVVLETDFPKETEKDLVSLMTGLKSGCRTLLYKRVLELPGVATAAGLKDGKRVGMIGGKQWVEIAPDDTYVTSWNSKDGGHHFDTWAKL